MATILEIIKNCAVELDIQTSSSINSAVSSTNNSIAQLVKLANRIGVSLSKNYQFAELRKRHAFNLVASQESYAIPGDFEHFLFDTFWDAETKRPMCGPLSPSEWEARKNGAVPSSVYYRYTVYGGATKKIYISPTPTTTNEIVFEYQSTNFCKPKTWTTSTSFTAGSYCFYEGNIYYTSAGGTTGSDAPVHTTGSDDDGAVSWEYFNEPYNKFLADTDEVLIDQDVLELGIMALYCRTKNLEGWDIRYGEYVNAAGSAAARFGGARTLSIGKGTRSRFLSDQDLPDSIEV
jgi:hypothetical protein